MKRFVANQNIRHFKEMLEQERDPARRALLERMIAEEQAKLDAEDAAASPGRPGQG